MADFVAEATDMDIENFGSGGLIDVDVDYLKEKGNVKTRRLIKAISQTENLEMFMSKNSQSQNKLLKQYKVPAKIENGKLIPLKKNISEINKVLDFLNENMFVGEISSNYYYVNSKKKEFNN